VYTKTKCNNLIENKRARVSADADAGERGRGRKWNGDGRERN